MRGYIKEGLELTPMGSFDVSKGGVNSRPGSHRIPEGVWTVGPGFSLCAAPCQVLGFKLNGDEGAGQGRIGVNSNGFL